MYNEELALAKELANEVGLFLRGMEIKTIESLEGKDIKLHLDKEAERLIIKKLKKNFNYPILSEEIGVVGEISNGRPYWIIDPIDGTMNYSKDCPFACVSIALWMDDRPILGVVYDFYRNELFSGLVGDRAWMNSVELIPTRTIEKSQAILATGFPTYLELTDANLADFVSEVKMYKKIRMFGSAALSLCYVACGRVDAYMENMIKLWDVAAGIAINSALNNNIAIEISEDFNTTTYVDSIHKE